MAKFKFEIQSCIEVFMEADNAEEARVMIIDSIYNYAEDMVGQDCYVSDGVEVENEDKN